jgi:hypothetical protein
MGLGMQRRNQTRDRLGRLAAVVIGAAWLAVVAGCAPRLVGIDRDALLRLKDQPEIRVVRHPPPAFDLGNPGNTVLGSVFGLSGGSPVAGAQGTGEITRAFGLTDPARTVEDRFTAALAFELGLSSLRPVDEIAAGDGLDDLHQAFGTGVVLDLKTIHWGLSPDSTLWTRYRLEYAARARLVRVEEATVVWQGVCDTSERAAERGATLGELTAHDAARLTEKFRDAAQACADALLGQILGSSARSR